MFLPIRCVVIGNSYGYVIYLDVAHGQFKSLEVAKSFTLWQRSLLHFTHFNSSVYFEILLH